MARFHFHRQTDFTEIRKERYYYIDKTRFPVAMLDSGKEQFFLARPHLLGKTLICGVLEELFGGNKALFEGLYAEEYMNRPDYQTAPVIRLNISKIDNNDGVEALEESLKALVAEAAKKFEVSGLIGTAAQRLGALLASVSASHGKVALIIDDYDKPYTDFYYDAPKATALRNAMRDFYAAIHAAEANLRFLFITGITPRTPDGVLSVFERLQDISASPDYGEICGFTEEEVSETFKSQFPEIERHRSLNKYDMIQLVQEYYGGFCFDGVHKNLLNPFAAGECIYHQRFKDYLTEYKKIEPMADYLFNKGLTSMAQFDEVRIPDKYKPAPYEMDAAPLREFLLMNGYITPNYGFFNYTNKEMRVALQRHVSMKIKSENIIFLDIDGVLQISDDRHEHIRQGDMTWLYKRLQVTLGIDYRIHDVHDVAAVYWDWDKKAVEMLKVILEVTNSKIVLSSDWKTFGFMQMKDLFAIHGLQDHFIDSTPISYDKEITEEDCKALKKRYPQLKDWDSRCCEILYWLDKHPYVKNWAAIDDLNLDALGEHFVRTRCLMTWKEAAQCLRVFLNF